MIFPPSHHIIQGLTALNIDFRLLKDEEAEVIRTQVMHKYVTRKDRPMWESISASASIQDVDGWLMMDEFLSGSSFLIFFDVIEDKRMVEVSAGASLRRILEECIQFEFYITDLETTYLLCFNHHDFLIGAGKAMQWVQTLD